LKAGSGGFVIAENISAAGSPATPAETVAQWAASPQLLANLMNPAFRDTGVGVVAAAPAVVGQGSGVTYTEDFGTRAAS
jgi:uncharacterized protein YkwD